MREYLGMVVDGGLPGRMEELQQLRLCYLTKHLYAGAIPTEAQVASAMQLTSAKARALLRSTLVRYSHVLDDGFRRRLVECLQEADFSDEVGRYEVVLASDAVVEAYNGLLERAAPNLDPVRKIRNTLRRFSISEDSYKVLKSELGLD